MRKIYALDDVFATGEPTVQPLLRWGAGDRPLYEAGRTKTASEALDYIKTVQPRPGMTISLVLALGAYERYDLNRNGDGFNEHEYMPGRQPTCGCCQAPNGAWVSQDETLLHHFRTFEEHGKVYRHHQNTDPLKACGDVLKAFWNPLMHRVELLIGTDRTLAPDLTARIDDGDYPAVSMGCRIKYDVCTICGHRAPTRKQYCAHLLQSMRQVSPSGLRAGALNPSPRFFDISWVLRPADQTGYMLKKVAAEHTYTVQSGTADGEYLDFVDQKRAALQKLSDIDKVVRGLSVRHDSAVAASDVPLLQQYQRAIQPAVSQVPVLDATSTKALAAHPLASVLGALSRAGVLLTTAEFMQLLLARLAPTAVVPPETFDAAVALQGEVFDLFAAHPQLLDHVERSALFDGGDAQHDAAILGIAGKYVTKRASITDYLARAVVPRSLRSEEPHWSDQLTVTDSNTGATYATTRGAAREAHDAIARRQLAKMVGGAALLAGGYKALAAQVPTSYRPLALGATALIGAQALRPDFGSQYMTNEGVPVSTLTELHKTSEARSIALPMLGSAALVAALSHDYESRLRRGTAHDPNAPVHKRLLDHLGAAAHAHPALSFLTGLGAYGAVANKLAALTEGALSPPVDVVHLPDVSFDTVAHKLGCLLLQ